MFQPFVSPASVEHVVKTLTRQDQHGRVWIGEGPEVKRFEDALCERFSFPYCVALNSGTAGLELALALADVGPGDEVVTTAQTCTATNMPILRAGATPVFADIQYYTGNIDPADIRHRITERTKAIMCVHWAGYPCDMDELNDIGSEYGIPVIQDGAHALGAEYHGQPIGVTSPFFMTSFQAIKQLTCGDGGLLAMTDEETYHAARRRRWFAIDRENREPRLDGYSFWDQSEIGYKMHMNDISAGIGLGNMLVIDRILQHRATVASMYTAALTYCPGVRVFRRYQDRKSANWLYTMHVENRDDFCRMMRDKDIDVGVVHIRNDAHTIFGPRRDDLPVTDEYERTNISIPIHHGVLQDDVHYIIESIKGGW
jgi:dTDP-4-amino-4,6-dideoxygalactose transaminase